MGGFRTISGVDCRHMNISPPDQLLGEGIPRKVHHVLARNFNSNAMVICRCREGLTYQLSGEGVLWEAQTSTGL